MFKIVTTAAIAALMTTTAMAATKIPALKFVGGQFAGTSQYTGLIDPLGLCAGLAGLTVGQNTSTVATIAGLSTATVSNTWTQTIANPNPSPTSQYGVSWVNCQFAALPQATQFIGVNIGTSAAPVYKYTWSPAPSAPAQVTSCLGSNGYGYTVTSSTAQVTTTFTNPLNSSQTATETAQQNLVITALPVNGKGADYGLQVTSTNSVLNALGENICYLSTDSLYLNTSK
jgi:hypothetical protein